MRFIRPDIIVVAILGCTAAAFCLDRSSSAGWWSNTVGNFLSVLVVSSEASPRVHFLQSSIAAANLSASGDSADVGRILILYHITAGEEWQNIVEDQAMKLMFSGLYYQLSRVHCTVSSSISNGTAQVSEVLSGYGSKFSVIEVPDDFQLSRSVATVSNLTNADRVLFLSTYGADAAGNSTAYEEVHQRRFFMEYEMIKNYRQRLDELRNSGIVGINDSSEASNNGTYFWWATGKHLLQNPKVFPQKVPPHEPRTQTGFARNFLRAKSSDSTVKQRIYQEGVAFPVPLEPSSYIDSGTPIASPCVTRQPDDRLTNGTISSCRIFIFHHIYVDNNWREIVMDQLAKIVFSGLYDRLTAVYSTLSGRDGTAMIAAEQLITSFGAKFFVLDHQLNSHIYERLTLYQIRTHVSADDVILYIHSKGVSGGAQNIDRQQLVGRRRIWHWRNAMEYFLIGLHETCLDLLDPSGLLVDKYDTVGINWIPGHHYSGNFWWSTGRHWKSLPDIIGPGYLDPENFIHLGSPRIASLWDTGLSGMGHYKADYFPREYSEVYNVSVLANN